MRIVRGSLSDAEADGAVTRRLADRVEASGEPALRVWTPPRQVAFGRRDATADGYEAARAAALDSGYEPVERSVGGRAVAYTGETVAFASVVPTDDDRAGIQSRYEDATDILQRAFRDLGATVRPGEPDDAFCPGDHSLQNGGKIAGLAQRVRRETALVGGCVVAVERDETDLAAVLDPVYDALGVRFDPDSVGSVEGAGGPGDVDRVVAAIEDAFVGDRDADVVAAPDLVDGAP
ncbi:lipoate--protein ligase family protein [Natronomonas salina]|uniref:lipoate--protein ligase family protein n=1 Tax=Natronomonas salina TaxID=1710540 RepID=UPI0015B716CB|nr:lipoate--protein ligase family protein [Natronomonas salina]QLD89378.1 lipoate--protein ligase family protein [Natronomonas salina]